MPNYHLLVRLVHDSPMTAVSIKLNGRDEALIAAQRYDAPAELWDGDTHV
jgi:hypothetical protein